MAGSSSRSTGRPAGPPAPPADKVPRCRAGASPTRVATAWQTRALARASGTVDGDNRNRLRLARHREPRGSGRLVGPRPRSRGMKYRRSGCRGSQPAPAPPPRPSQRPSRCDDRQRCPRSRPAAGRRRSSHRRAALPPRCPVPCSPAAIAPMRSLSLWRNSAAPLIVVTPWPERQP